jgi:stage II sporulation protein P
VAGLQAAAKAGQDGAVPPATPARIAAPVPGARGTPARTTARPLIAVYHTHSDESYVPTDGTESIEGKGTIFKVGDAMTRALEAVGFRVAHSRQPHDPHDAAAYDRSRGTARQLLQKGPVAIFDVHRDTAPPEAYEARVAGENVDQILIVLGRENPSLKVNEAFAKRLKAAMDQRFPGLIRGLFYGLGKYNQDLSPHALLLEVGSHVTPRTSAERGISLFARGLPPVLGTAQARGTVAGGAGTEARRAASTIGWVLLVVAVGAAVFLGISTGSATEAAERFRRFWRQEVGIRGGTGRGEDEDDGKRPGRRGGR